jgi:hypothetical protein
MDDSGNTTLAAASPAITKHIGTEVTPFRRSSSRGAAEFFADALLGADGLERVPWWVKAGAGLLTAAGITAAFVWSWFTAHALLVLGPAVLLSVAAFLILCRGARQRERRLTSEIDQHTLDQVDKTRRELATQIATRVRLNEQESEAALAAEWNDPNPLGRLLKPNVFFVFLTGSVLSVHTSVSNVYYLPRMLRCTSCVVTFRRRDPDFGHFADITSISVNGWSAEIPGGTPQYDVPQTTPSSISETQADAIRKARNSGLIDVHVQAQYAAMVGAGAGAHETSENFQFCALLIGA